SFSHWQNSQRASSSGQTIALQTEPCRLLRLVALHSSESLWPGYSRGTPSGSASSTESKRRSKSDSSRRILKRGRSLGERAISFSYSVSISFRLHSAG